MNIFGIHSFNPQPEPPPHAGQFFAAPHGGGETHYEYKLDRVVVTSYNTSGSG